MFFYTKNNDLKKKTSSLVQLGFCLVPKIHCASKLAATRNTQSTNKLHVKLSTVGTMDSLRGAGAKTLNATLASGGRLVALFAHRPRQNIFDIPQGVLVY